MPFAATWMDLEIAILSEVRQRRILHDITYMWNLKKMIQMNSYTNIHRLIDIKQTMITKGENKRWEIN